RAQALVHGEASVWVELGRDAVGEQPREDPARRGAARELRELERERDEPLLTLRGVEARGVFSHPELELVPLRTERGCEALPIAAPALAERAAHHLGIRAPAPAVPRRARATR